MAWSFTGAARRCRPAPPQILRMAHRLPSPRLM